MPLTNYLLLADVEDVIKALVPVIVMVLWGLGQLMGARPKQNPPVQPRQIPPPAQPAAPGPAGKPPTLEETLRREVEEFMRRAQGRGEQPKRQPQKPQQPGGARREGRPARPAAQGPAPARRLVDAPRPLGQQPETPTPARNPPTGASVGEHVQEHLTRSREALATHAQHLGADVAQADERMEEHLQEKFTHQLGALQQQQRTTEPQRKAVRPAFAQELFDMLKKPGGVRQVIVAGEILRRPEERWRPHGSEGG